MSLSHYFFVTLLTQLYACRYGAHLSKEQVAELVAPHPDALQLVGSWIAHHEVPSSAAVSITHGGNWLTIYNVPLTKANALLGAEYQSYLHAETNETVIRTISYALPAALHEYVQTVAPTTYFGAPRALGITSKLGLNGPKLSKGDLDLQDASTTYVPGTPVPPSCSSAITPTCLRMLYNTLTYVPQATSKNKLGVTGYLQQFASQTDLTNFLTRFRSDAVPARFSVVTVNGGINNETDPGIEVRRALYVDCGDNGCNISSRRPILISNTPNRSPTRLQISSITLRESHPSSPMSLPPRTRTSLTWTGSISS
jgi:tripeptidyl-peptidase-1